MLAELSMSVAVVLERARAVHELVALRRLPHPSASVKARATHLWTSLLADMVRGLLAGLLLARYRVQLGDAAYDWLGAQCSLT